MHIGIRGDGVKSGEGKTELFINQFQLSLTSARSVVPITGLYALRAEAEDAAKGCFKNFKYIILLDNCQTFTIDVLTELH